MELHERISAPADETRHPLVDPFAEVKNRIHVGLIDDLGRQLFNTDIDPAALRIRVDTEIAARLDQESGISREDREHLAAALADDILGHGPLERLLADDSVTEIMVNGPYEVWLEREGHLHLTAVRFDDESHLRRIIGKIARRGTQMSSPSRLGRRRASDGLIERRAVHNRSASASVWATCTSRAPAARVKRAISAKSSSTTAA